MSKQRSKGTSFETGIVRYLRERLNDNRIERRALHGNYDLGDIWGLRAHGYEGIVEAKDYARFGPADLAKWREQTVIERGNADADFALLVVHEKGCGKARFGQNSCHMQIRDLEKIVGGTFRCLAGDRTTSMWVRVTLDDACRMILGE